MIYPRVDMTNARYSTQGYRRSLQNECTWTWQRAM